MRGIAQFIGANLFLLGMLVAGGSVVVGLTFASRALGATDETLLWLYWPIGMMGIFTTYFAGKFGHRALAKLL